MPMPRKDFLSRYLENEAGCWVYQGPLDPKGYGVAGMFGRAHRYFYKHLVGPIPGDLTIDHLCKNTSCVNPSHMEPVTRAENTRRAREAASARTHCPHGHEFTPGNTYTYPDGYRECRTCRKRYVQEFRAKYGRERKPQDGD